MMDIKIDRDITSKKLIAAKGVLFLLLGIFSGSLLILDRPTITTFLLLLITVWSFARFYYFMFYVITNYVDNDYKYSGFISFISQALAFVASNDALKITSKEEKVELNFINSSLPCFYITLIWWQLDHSISW